MVLTTYLALEIKEKMGGKEQRGCNDAKSKEGAKEEAKKA